MSAAFLDAVVKYRVMFPTLNSLGTSAATWAAELAAVAPGAFDPITGTSLNVEGGNIAGVLNFPQMQLVRALHKVRADLDSSYTNPYSLAADDPRPGRRIGHVVSLESAGLPDTRF